jgi:hypothetical protein
MDNIGSFPGVKRLGCGADNSLPFSAEVLHNTVFKYVIKYKKPFSTYFVSL